MEYTHYGLKNFGNECYINSALQILTNRLMQPGLRNFNCHLQVKNFKIRRKVKFRCLC